jgi:L-threonylcarbamoyladenylate synthase
LIPTLDVSSAVEVLKKGGIIAYPTETFYGLGCDATRAESIKKLFEIKGRSSKVAIPVLISDVEKLPLYTREVPRVAQTLIEKFWPGPLTLVFLAQELFPKELLAETGKIALRVSSHPIARELCQRLIFPLTTTSANPSGKAPAKTSKEVKNYFDNIDGIIEGEDLSSSKGSTIVDVTCDPPKILRQGDLSLEEII